MNTATETTRGGDAAGRHYDAASSDELRHDIDRTRAEMDRTVDALENRLSPGRLLDDAWTAFRSGGNGGGSRLAHNLTDTLRDHPMPLALIGAGLGWLLIDTLTSSSDRGDSSDRDLPTRYRPAPYGPGVVPVGRPIPGGDVERRARYGGDGEDEEGVADKARAKASDAADTVRGAASGAKARAADAGHRAGDTLHDWADEARYRGRRAKAGIWHAIDENPLAVGTVAAALGVLAGLSVPASEWEDEVMGEASDRALAKAKDAGRDALHTAGEVADRAVHAAAEKADEEGWSAESLSESARAVGREAKKAAGSEAKRQGATVDAAAKKVEAAAERAQRTGQASGRSTGTATGSGTR